MRERIIFAYGFKDTEPWPQFAQSLGIDRGATGAFWMIVVRATPDARASPKRHHRPTAAGSSTRPAHRTPSLLALAPRSLPVLKPWHALPNGARSSQGNGFEATGRNWSTAWLKPPSLGFNIYAMEARGGEKPEHVTVKKVNKFVDAFLSQVDASFGSLPSPSDPFPFLLTPLAG